MRTLLETQDLVPMVLVRKAFKKSIEMKPFPANGLFSPGVIRKKLRMKLSVNGQTQKLNTLDHWICIKIRLLPV